MKKIVTQPFGVLLGYYCYMSSPCDFKELSGRLGSHRPGQEIYLGPPLLFFFVPGDKRQHLTEGLQPWNSRWFAICGILFFLLELESLHPDLSIDAVSLLPFLKNPPDKQHEVTQLAPAKQNGPVASSLAFVQTRWDGLNHPDPDVDTHADTLMGPCEHSH